MTTKNYTSKKLKQKMKLLERKWRKLAYLNSLMERGLYEELRSCSNTHDQYDLYDSIPRSDKGFSGLAIIPSILLSS